MIFLTLGQSQYKTFGEIYIFYKNFVYCRFHMIAFLLAYIFFGEQKCFLNEQKNILNGHAKMLARQAKMLAMRAKMLAMREIMLAR